MDIYAAVTDRIIEQIRYRYIKHSISFPRHCAFIILAGWFNPQPCNIIITLIFAKFKF